MVRFCSESIENGFYFRPQKDKASVRNTAANELRWTNVMDGKAESANASVSATARWLWKICIIENS